MVLKKCFYVKIYIAKAKDINDMIYTANYGSPIGNLLLASKEGKLIGLWMEGQKYYLSNLKDKTEENDRDEMLIMAKNWLDRYFKGDNPSIDEFSLDPMGSEFRKEVWKILCKIPYGSVTTYNNIARDVAKTMGKDKMSAQAVGGAVAHNPISIIIPCHRVVGSSGSLTGYAGGIDKKVFLLKHENADMSRLFIPKRGTAL